MKDSENYFYANEDVNHFDATAEMSQPEYTLLNESAAKLLSRSLGRGESDFNPIVLDLGAGTGAETIALLRLIPHAEVVAFDLSQEMLDKMKQKIENEFGEMANVAYRQGDVNDAQWTANALKAANSSNSEYDAVISGFLIHHYDEKQRAELYSRVYDCLRRGGVFINIDLFDYQSPTMSQYSREVGEDWISVQFSDRAHDAYQGTAKALGNQLGVLRTKWIDHLQHENVPSPVETHSNGLGPGVKISGQKDSNAELLFQAGFIEVACPIRFWQAGVLWAKR